MGVLTITTRGSFPSHARAFGADGHGHAHAVAQAIAWLSEEVLPEAIERDHLLHARGLEPTHGFARPTSEVTG